MADSERPKVIMVAGKVPEPIRSGLDLRIRSQIQALSLTHNVTLVSLSDAQPGALNLPAQVVSIGSRPQPTQDEVVRGFLANPTDPFRTLVDREASRRLTDVVSQHRPDAVIVSRIHNWVYADSIRRATTSPVILDLDESAERLLDSFSRLPYEGIARSLHLRYTRAVSLYEARRRGEADAILVSSFIEKAHLDVALEDLPQIFVAVNAIDTSNYLRSRTKLDGPDVAFTGNLAYPPNFYAAREIIDLIAPMNTDMHFTIAGSYAPTSIYDQLPTNVTVKSPVEDMASVFCASDVALMPLRAGGGTRFKALEAMATGIPCIGTAIAFEGLAVREESEVIIAETREEMSNALHAMLTDSKFRDAICANALDYVSSQHSIRKLREQLLSVPALMLS